jgi:hypothetical protein
MPRDQLQSIAAATGKLNADGQRRLKEIMHLLAAGTGRRSETKQPDEARKPR